MHRIGSGLAHFFFFFLTLVNKYRRNNIIKNRHPDRLTGAPVEVPPVLKKNVIKRKEVGKC